MHSCYTWNVNSSQYFVFCELHAVRFFFSSSLSWNALAMKIDFFGYRKKCVSYVCLFRTIIYFMFKANRVNLIRQHCARDKTKLTLVMKLAAFTVWKWCSDIKVCKVKVSANWNVRRSTIKMQEKYDELMDILRVIMRNIFWRFTFWNVFGISMLRQDKRYKFSSLHWNESLQMNVDEQQGSAFFSFLLIWGQFTYISIRIDSIPNWMH